MLLKNASVVVTVLWLISPALAWAAGDEASGTAGTVDFNRDVRPILSENCYFCHGPDADSRQAGLRLDVREAAIDVIDSGELVDRIHHPDADVLMPPPESKIQLTAKQKRTLDRWIEQGAAYQQHWAFEPLPASVDPPALGDIDRGRGRWSRQPLDRFVLANLNVVGVPPSPPAEPLRWLRRASLDLTGLPPTGEQIDRFETLLSNSKDSGDDQAVYQTMTDRLLGSAAFGEHMAVAWLDAARYADSYGYQSDKLNTQWPYRDWVVRAINQNLPYDQFLTWQLAGDLLDHPTEDSLLATAFNRLHRLNNEGGVVFEEWRIENVADRVQTFGTAMLGLTLECCRCHDHKYDPISAKEYYSLSAFFNSIDESGVYDRTEKVPCPSMLLPTTDQAESLRQAQNALADAETQYLQTIQRARGRYEGWRLDQNVAATVPDSRLALSFDIEYHDSLKSIYHPSASDRSGTSMPDLVAVTDSPVRRLPIEQADDVISNPEEPPATGQDRIPPRLAMQLDGERGITTEGVRPFDRWLPMTVLVTMRETNRSPQRRIIAHHTRGTDSGYNGWDLTIQDGHLESRMARVWPGNAISVRTIDPIAFDRWHQIAATYDGSSAAGGLKLYLDGTPLPTEVVRDGLKKSCNVAVNHGGQFVVGQRFRDRGFSGGQIDDVRVYDRDLTIAELTHLARPGVQIDPTFEYYISAIDPLARQSREHLTETRRGVVMAEEVMMEVPIMRELDPPRPTHLLARGQYDAPKNEQTRVRPGVPASLAIELPDDAPLDRLALARWVTDPNHPLTARVAVNRLWGNFFTAPLVHTPENFGSQGNLPTHPELLDWLARDFIDGGWDVKALCRSIVLSATYRQQSSATAEQLERDPTNRLLARGPSYRLAAEQIRDLALTASGLINPEIGGPPVSPYQPGKDLWRESNGMSPPFGQSVGRSLYRRSLYSVWKRTSPLPNMMAFDSTTREVCTVKRSRTNTPLQALVLLNDVQFVEASRMLAERLIANRAKGSVAVRPPIIDDAFLRLCGRRPDPVERQALADLYAEEKSYYVAHLADAQALLSLGDAAASSEVDPAELAAWTNVCQTILNLDSTIWKR